MVEVWFKVSEKKNTLVVVLIIGHKENTTKGPSRVCLAQAWACELMFASTTKQGPRLKDNETFTLVLPSLDCIKRIDWATIEKKMPMTALMECEDVNEEICVSVENDQKYRRFDKNWGKKCKK